MRSQIATSSWGGSSYRPYAFTEQGVAMLSGILNSEKAINVNIFIIRTFVLMRQYALDYTGLEEKDESEKQKENFKNRPRIGFKQRDKD